MKRGFVLTSTLVVGLLTAVAPLTNSSAARSPGAENLAESVFRQAREYTVRVRMRVDTPFAGDEQGAFQGAGFLIDAERGWIVTNAHVAGRAASVVQVAFHGQPYQPARKLYVDSFADIAVLTLDHPVSRKPARLAGSALATVGEPVGAYGHPLGLPFTGTRGIVSGHTDQAGPKLTQIDATVDHGNSGGPVIALRTGEVIGIATSGALGDKRDRMNFATPIADVHRIVGILRSGGSPSPPRLAFALLHNEDDLTTMRVAETFDAERWPFQPGDSIVAIVGVPGSVRSLDDLVGGLRGRTGEVGLTVRRAGALTAVTVRPVLRPIMVEQRGLLLDGALIAPLVWDDNAVISTPGLVVHSVAPSSAAQSLGISSGDMLMKIDGQRFTTVDSLVAYVRAHPGQSLQVEVRRFTSDTWRIFESHLRELPGEDIQLIGPEGTTSIASN